MASAQDATEQAADTAQILGLHHVTAIAGEPQRNVEFYTGLLGLRLVKVTVNYDDPGSYHLYYGDALGYPGTIVTFFAWPGGRRGRPGTGQLAGIALAIPETALGYWRERLEQQGVRFEGPSARFDEQVLAFADPDGLPVELVAAPTAEARAGWAAWTDAPVPAEHAIRGLHAASLWEDDAGPTARLLTEAMGFRSLQEEAGVTRYAVGAGGSGALADVRRAAAPQPGVVAVGTVHHVAWRTPTDAQQLTWRRALLQQGAHVTPVLDRQYFHSIYFREPGGVLFEIATDPPGFTTDEPPERLGTALRLPGWLEPERAAIERALPPLRLPGDNEH